MGQVLTAEISSRGPDVQKLSLEQTSLATSWQRLALATRKHITQAARLLRRAGSWVVRAGQAASVDSAL